LHCPLITIEDVRKWDLLAQLTDVLSDGVSQDLWLLSVGIDNNPWGQYQPLVPTHIGVSGKVFLPVPFPEYSSPPTPPYNNSMCFTLFVIGFILQINTFTHR
jgi:hypothetical protein